jgi:cyanophycinase
MMNIAMGYLLLAGGAEFSGRMIDADKRAIELAGGNAARVDIIPAAAVPEDNHRRAGQNGIHWFTKLGVCHVVSQPLIDQRSAQRLEIANSLRHSSFIYLLGGFPSYLAQSLRDTLSWQSIQTVFTGGGVVGGSSAGAMVLCQFFYDPARDRIEVGLGMLPGTCVIPHHNRHFSKWVNRLRSLLPDQLLLGIDERTAIINDAAAGGWIVYGEGKVVVYSASSRQSYAPGNIIYYNDLQPPQI